ncbi:tyrosine-type recombinase/integrase [Halalkalibacter akibai]|uniref:tyrosine-type recombinase/integrase n=1 Tax=Halalkalibacter akibai TaxID=1411 RepID=UPI00068E889A|nr:site-specific integrase [Halalkalibacter akibai]
MLIFDLEYKPFPPLIIFYDDQNSRLAESTLRSYLNALLPFFTWLDRYSNYQGKRVKWDGESDVVRHAVDTYLRDELNCSVVIKDNYSTVEKSANSPSSYHQFISAANTFYKTMIRKKIYPYKTNPLIDIHASLGEDLKQTGEREGKPRMPAVAGTEEPIHESHRRWTDSYFKITNEDWIPVVIADRDLPYQVYKAGDKVRWNLREKVIARLLFETGARASEIITMTIGAYRQRRDKLEAQVIDKGSQKVRRKFIRFTDDTLILLKRYVNTERKGIDPLGLTFDQLPDSAPIFITQRNTPLTHNSWYRHWNKAMKREGLSLNPHKARHWYVTNRMRLIKEAAQSEGELAKKMAELVVYMAWRSGEEMLSVYEHFFTEEEAVKSIDVFQNSMKKQEQEYLKERSSRRKKQKKKQVETVEIPSTIVDDIQEDQDIADLFEELENYR